MMTVLFHLCRVYALSYVHYEKSSINVISNSIYQSNWVIHDKEMILVTIENNKLTY